MFISPSFTRMVQAADKASLLTASGMLFHQFPENCVYRHSGINCFIKYLHRKLLTTNFSVMILKVLKQCAFIGIVY